MGASYLGEKVIGRPDVPPPAEEGSQKAEEKKKKERKKNLLLSSSQRRRRSFPSLLKRNTCSVGASKYEIQFSSPKQCFY